MYTWQVIYQDDTIMSEFDGDRKRGFAEANSGQIKAIELKPLGNHALPSHRVDIPVGAVPVCFRRHKGMDSITNRPDYTVHCIGFQYMHDACYLFVFDDGSTLLSSDLQAV
jgi:hypothetical protein